MNMSKDMQTVNVLRRHVPKIRLQGVRFLVVVPIKKPSWMPWLRHSGLFGEESGRRENRGKEKERKMKGGLVANNPWRV